MVKEVKPIVNKEDSFDLLDIRMGKIIEIKEIDPPHIPKASYHLKIDFGKFGTRESVARFRSQSKEELLGMHIFAVLNFPSREVGGVDSQVLVLGIQVPKKESGEASPVVPFASGKLGAKLF